MITESNSVFPKARLIFLNKIVHHEDMFDLRVRNKAQQTEVNTLSLQIIEQKGRVLTVKAYNTGLFCINQTMFNLVSDNPGVCKRKVSSIKRRIK